MKDISQLIQERNELLKSHIAGQFIKADKLDGHWVTSEETGKHIFIGADGQPKYTREQIEGGSGSLGGVADEPSDGKKESLEDLKLQHIKLTNQALKTFPNSQKQLEIRKQRDEIGNKIKELESKEVKETKTESKAEDKSSNDIKDSKMTVSKLEDKSKEELLDLKKDKENAIKNPKTHPNVAKFHQEGLDKINKLLDSDKHKDKEESKTDNKGSGNKFTNTEQLLVNSAKKRVPNIDEKYVMDLADKIAKHDKYERKLEHVAEALQYEVSKNEPDYGRISEGSLKTMISDNKLSWISNLERMNDIGILPKEGKKDLELLRKMQEKRDSLKLDNTSNILIKNYFDRFIFDSDNEDRPARDQINHAIKLFDDISNESTLKENKVTAVAGVISDRFEKEKEGNIKNAKPINKDIKITNIAPLEKIVKESKNVKEAFDKIRQIKNVSSETAKQFSEKYNPDNNLTMMDSFERFYNDVKGK